VRAIVRPAPAVFSTRRRVLPRTPSSAWTIAAAMRSAAASRSSSVAAPGWKHTAPTPRAVERSSSFARPSRARVHFSVSGVATFSTYAACTTTRSGAIFVAASASRKRATRSGLIDTLSP